MKNLEMLDRAVFKRLTQEYPDSVISRAYLRKDNIISNSSQTYQVPLLADGQIANPAEQLLNKNDVFFMYGLGIYLTKGENTSSTAPYGEIGRSVLQTYPNQQFFVAAAGFTPTDLEVFYQGQVNLLVNTVQYINQLDTTTARYVPQTQQSAATNYSQLEDGDGVISLGTYYRLSGSDDINLSLTVPTFTGIEVAAVAATTVNVLTVKPRGFVIKGGARLKPRKRAMMVKQ